MDYEDDNYSTDSSEARERDAKKAIVEVVEEEESIPVPEYSDDELNKLLLYIQQIATCHDLSEDDISDLFLENATKWLMDVLETTLFVYFDQGYLCASAACPTCPVNYVTYFIREDLGHVFTISGFHDEITFGTFHENVEETILYLMNTIYAPLILKDKRWDENVKMKLFNELHSFMAHLTDVNSKIGSFVILYVPNEGHSLLVEEAVLDKPLIKRYENVVIYWICQIRLCLNDMDNVQYDLACPSDEYDFWVYKFEVLSGIEEQIRHKNIEHILNILQKSQSLFINKFKTLRDELNKEIQRSNSNARFLKLLVEPCMELEASELPKDVPAKLPNIIYLIRVISLNCEYYKEKKNTERLFSNLSNEIINYCKSKVDIPKILSGHPRFGIKICDMSIDCCFAYKLIFKRLVERLQTEDFRKTWIFDEAKIFNQIDIFIQRLTDIMEICETIIVFGRCDETVHIPPLIFGCYNAKEFTMTCRDMEKKFEGGLKEIKISSHMILDVHNKDWYQEMSTFKKLIKSLEEIVHNLLVNVFISINNVEEALDALTTMHNFSKRLSLQAEYINKVEEMWGMFESEVVAVNKDITRLDKEHPGCLPQNAGKSLILNIKMKKCERLKDLLMSAHYLPKVPIAEEKLKMFELTVENVKKQIEEYNNEWSSKIITQPMNYLNRTLINRSPTHGGLLECNIDRNLLPLFEETKYFDFMEIAIPSVLIQTYPKARKTISIFNKVVNVILLHNKILCSLSDKERLLFKEHIKVMDRKVSAGMFRLTYSDEMTDVYISECLKHLEELQHFVDIYKIINMVNVRLFEEISNGQMLNINIKSIGTLDHFKSKFKESRNSSVSAMGEVYRKVIEYIIVVYEGFESHLNNDISEKWISYIRKIDSLAEYAMLNCAKNTLVNVFNLLHGKNDMKPEPFISIEITLKDRDITFEPSLESVARALNNIYRDIIKSIRIFPRLNDKFQLPPSPDIKEFHEVVSEDRDCQTLLIRINEVIQENLEKTSDYIYTWSHFRPIFDIDIDRFMANYQTKGLKLEEFAASMNKYFDVANQVMMQDTTTTITFITYNCSRLKDSVLGCIANWKRSYKQTLCATTLKKLESHNDLLTSRIGKLNEQPSNYDELEAALKLHEHSMGEMKKREDEMGVIREFYSYLEKYDIDIPTTIKKNFESMPANWNWYCEQLREVEDNLFKQKEKFKMGLLTSVTKIKQEVQEMADKLEEEISSSSELTSQEGFGIVSAALARVEQFEITKNALDEQLQMMKLQVSFFELFDVKVKLEVLNDLMTLTAKLENFFEFNCNTNFWALDLELLEKQLLLLSKRVTQACEEHKDWSFLTFNKNQIDSFKAVLLMLLNLRNQHLKQRHWSRIRELVNQNFDENSQDFNIKSMLEMDFLKISLAIEEISEAATVELQVENDIKAVADACSKLKLKFLPFKGRFLMVELAESCLQTSQGHSALIAKWKKTKFIEPFQDAIDEWEKTLTEISEVIEKLLKVQKLWLELHMSFEDEKTRRKSPADAERFQKVSTDFQEVLRCMKAAKTVLEATRIKEPAKITNAFESMLKTLERIERNQL